MFGMDEPLYFSTHCPPADLASEGGAVVHVMRYGARDGVTDQAELWDFAARCQVRSQDAVTQRFRPHMTVSYASPVPENGGRGGGGPPRPSGRHRGRRHRGTRRVNDTAVFETERPRLLGLAYRLLGSVVDAEDVVQEAWIRWDAIDGATIERPPAWLTTVTTRLALDRIRSAEHRRTAYVGPWLPEPVALDPSPEDSAELAESLTFGFLVLLDQLSGIERAVLLLADVFGQPFREIAETVGRSESACRQIAPRARRRVREAGADRHNADDAMLAQLVDAMGRGDAPALLELLHPDVVLVSDGGANRHAGRRPVLGPERVARVLLNLTKRIPAGSTVDFQPVNLQPAVVIRMGGETIVLQVDQHADRAERIRVVVNPDKTRHLDEAVHLT